MTITTARHIASGGGRREINVAPRAGPGVFNLLVTRGGEVVELYNIERKRRERERERVRKSEKVNGNLYLYCSNIQYHLPVHTAACASRRLHISSSRLIS